MTGHLFKWTSFKRKISEVVSAGAKCFERFVLKGGSKRREIQRNRRSNGMGVGVGVGVPGTEPEKNFRAPGNGSSDGNEQRAKKTHQRERIVCTVTEEGEGVRASCQKLTRTNHPVVAFT